jgi:predicted enzyme related to lactoylglutathione lyase
MGCYDPEMSSKATGVDAVYFSVQDVSRASAFYKALLAVSETTWENEHGAEWVLADGTAFGVGRLPDGHRPSGTVLFTVDDIEASCGTVTANGGSLVGELRELPSCAQQWCTDPDGNAIVLHRRRTT